MSTLLQIRYSCCCRISTIVVEPVHLPFDATATAGTRSPGIPMCFSDYRVLVAAWPELPQEVRAEILAKVGKGNSQICSSIYAYSRQRQLSDLSFFCGKERLKCNQVVSLW